jgi:hypothetical protein
MEKEKGERHFHDRWASKVVYIYSENYIIQTSDNPNTTQTLEYTKDKYNAKIRK